MTFNDTQRTLRKAARTALGEWYSGQYNLQEQELDDLSNDLWIWYLERPSVREKLEDSDPKLSHRLAVQHAFKLLAGEALAADVFAGKTLFSSEAVKDALKGRSTNKYLLAVLPMAMAAVQHKDDQSDRGYAEALRKRYEDFAIPVTKREENQLFNAHKVITDEVNVHVLTVEVKGVGSDKVVFPNLRRANGGHSDPTGDTALMLMDPKVLERDPNIRANYLEETTWDVITKGQAAEPAYQVFVGGPKIRPTGDVAEILVRQPELVDLYTALAEEELLT